MNSVNDIVDYINNLAEIKRLHELEHYIDNNQTIKTKMEELNLIKKKMVNSKEFNQINQYKIYKEEYNILYNELCDLPFVEEYIELVEYANNLLISIKDSIESRIKL